MNQETGERLFLDGFGYNRDKIRIVLNVSKTFVFGTLGDCITSKQKASNSYGTSHKINNALRKSHPF